MYNFTDKLLINTLSICYIFYYIFIINLLTDIYVHIGVYD